MYMQYRVSLMSDKTLLYITSHLLSCTNISCDNHIADIENIYSRIVYACILSTSITVQYQKKVTTSRNITPGWNREVHYARESSLFWKRM